MHVGRGAELWPAGEEFAGFPHQGVRFRWTWALQYTSISVGFRKMRIWLFIGWGSRW